MFNLAQDSPGSCEFLMGNEAIARGALEAGVQVCASYPGTPSTEITESLAEVAGDAGIHVEWSTNEKVALEVAAAASMSGLRALTAMKNEGLNVALDFLAHLNLSGLGDKGGGLLVIPCDDPSGHSSPSEGDARWAARSLDLPLLEPGGIQEAKDMTKWAFELSETVRLPCLVRSCTRISHTTGNVVLGELPKQQRRASFDAAKDIASQPATQKHAELHQKLSAVQEIFEKSPFNSYEGPERPELLIVCSGSGRLHALEAIGELKLTGSVGILKLGTTWPLPRQLIIQNLARSPKVLVVEEVDPLLESSLKVIAYESPEATGSPRIYGKASRHIAATGELTPDSVIKALCQIFSLAYMARDAAYDRRAEEIAGKMVSTRVLVACPGCPHRASFWSVKTIFGIEAADGFATGDIGCYGLDRRPGGYQVAKTLHAMGSGAGLASGFGALGRFGFNQVVLGLAGDSTFYHASIPALINAVHNQSKFLLIILDNSATAMTGFQSHPGIGHNAVGGPAPAVSIEKLCRATGAKVEISDPFDLEGTRHKLQNLLQEDGVRTLILRRKCELVRWREERRQPYSVRIDPGKCLGEGCGCDRYCTRIFKCPGLSWDEKTGKARIEITVCSGCGVCANICPEKAIIREAVLS